MTLKEVQRILLYHNKCGFTGDLRDLYGKIKNIRDSNSEISSLPFGLAMPKNRKTTSTVEMYVMRSATLLDLEVQAREIERFIQRLNHSIACLPYNEKQVILLRYFNRDNTTMDFINIAFHVKYSIDWCERLNKQGLITIAQELEGVQVTWFKGE